MRYFSLAVALFCLVGCGRLSHQAPVLSESGIADEAKDKAAKREKELLEKANAYKTAAKAYLDAVEDGKPKETLAKLQKEAQEVGSKFIAQHVEDLTTDGYAPTKFTRVKPIADRGMTIKFFKDADSRDADKDDYFLHSTIAFECDKEGKIVRLIGVVKKYDK